jgi:hypothetical protein
MASKRAEFDDSQLPQRLACLSKLVLRQLWLTAKGVFDAEIILNQNETFYIAQNQQLVSSD